MNKFIFIFVFSITLGYSLNTAKINKALEKSIKENHLNSALIGIKVINLNTDKVIYSKNSSKNFIPGSNTKLLTAATAFLFFDKNFKYQTSLYYDKLTKDSINNLYIDFSGDPSFTTEDLNSLLSKLKNLNIRKINNIILVNRFFTGRDIPINQSQSSSVFAYGAPSSIYNLNENAISVRLTPKANSFATNQTAGEPIKIKNKLRIMTPQFNKCQLNISNHNNVLKLSGCLPSNSYNFDFSISSPEKVIKYTILKELSKINISVTNQIKYSDKLPKLKLLNSHYSANIISLLKHMLVYSDNVYTQTIIRTIGYYYYGVGSFKAGTSASIEILENKLKLNLQNISLEDGAGISENDLMSPDNLIDLLSQIHKQKNFETFKDLLPIYGKTGTLRNREGEKLKDKVFAKTGANTTAVALSGYLFDKDTYAFSILINGITDKQRPQAFILEKDLLENLLLSQTN